MSTSNWKQRHVATGFVPLKVTGVPEDEQVFFENGDFEGLLKHAGKGRDRNRQAFKEGKEKQEE